MRDGLIGLVREWRSNVEVAPLPPPVRVELVNPIRAVWLRAVAAAMAMATVMILSLGGLSILIAVAFGVVLMFSRVAMAPALLGLFTAVLVVVADAFTQPIHVVIFGVHLVLALTAIVGDLPPGALIERSVLVERLPRFLVIQGFAQLAALLAAPVHRADGTAPTLAIAAAVTLAVAVWAGVIAIRGPSRD